MNLSPDTLLILAIAIPIVAIIPILLCRRWPNVRELWSLLAAVATAASVWSMLEATLEGQAAEAVLFELTPGVSLAFRSDAAGLLFALLASGLWV